MAECMSKEQKDFIKEIYDYLYHAEKDFKVSEDELIAHTVWKHKDYFKRLLTAQDKKEKKDVSILRDCETQTFMDEVTSHINKIYGDAPGVLYTSRQLAIIIYDNQEYFRKLLTCIDTKDRVTEWEIKCKELENELMSKDAALKDYREQIAWLEHENDKLQAQMDVVEMIFMGERY